MNKKTFSDEEIKEFNRLNANEKYLTMVASIESLVRAIRDELGQEGLKGIQKSAKKHLNDVVAEVVAEMEEMERQKNNN